MGREKAAVVVGRIIEIPTLEDPEAVTADERHEHILLLEAARNRIDQQLAETIGVADELSDHDAFGYPSTVSYLKAAMRFSPPRAHRTTVLARNARKFKATFLSWKHNQISKEQAEELFRAAREMPDQYPAAESVLIEIAGDTVGETKQMLDYWRQTVDLPGVLLDEEIQYGRRRFDVSTKASGMVEGEFSLPRLAGETLLTAIDALMPPPAANDRRTTSQRRADALEDLARGYLEGAEAPEVSGERPHLNIHVDEGALAQRPGGLHELESGEVLTMTEVRQLACDSSVSRIVWNGKSEIIDVGRKTRVAPAATRRAVIARDRHCIFPGCDRSPRWCDVHHLDHWADGGTTNLSNLCLLCRYHHTMVHQDETLAPVLMERIERRAQRRRT